MKAQRVVGFSVFSVVGDWIVSLTIWAVPVAFLAWCLWALLKAGGVL